MSAIEIQDLKFSIITVCLNAQETILDTLASVSAQRWKNIQHIVIDGGSTDATIEKIAPYRDRLSVFVSEPDRGIYDAMNKGLSFASGDVVAFLNADDAYADEIVLSDVAAKFRSLSIDAVYGDVLYIRDDALRTPTRLYSSRSFSPKKLAFGWMPAHPALFVRREVFLRDGFFDADFRIAGDFEFIARVFSTPNFRYAYLPRVLTNMRTGGASAFGWKSVFTVNREILRACQLNGIKSNYWKLLMRYPKKFMEQWF